MARLTSLISLSGALVSFALLNLAYIPLPGTAVTVIQLQFAFTAERAQRILALWGAPGQSLFVSTIYLDYLFPVFYGMYLFFVSSTRPARAAAVIAALADMLENSLHVLVIQGTLPIDSGAIPAASLSACLKWGCILYVAASKLRAAAHKA